MPNAIKYNTSAETLALKKGNFWIGTGDVGKGPTSNTGFYNGITPPWYTIYLNKGANGPSIYTVSDNTQFISLTNTIAGQTFATAAAALDWYNSQTDKMVFNTDYPAIVTSGLTLNLDAGFTPSYPTTGATWYDVSASEANGTLVGSPTFVSGINDFGGSFTFNGSNQYVNLTTSSIFTNASYTIETWQKILNFPSSNFFTTVSVVGQGPDFTGKVISIRWYQDPDTLASYIYVENRNQSAIVTTDNSYDVNTWCQVVFTYNYSNNTAIVYINGVQNVSGAFTPFVGTSPTIQIGALTSQFSWYGSIAANRFYNRVLSATEVLQNYNAEIAQQNVFNPDYQAILNYATTQGYTLPSPGQRAKQNQLLVGLKRAGAWSKLDTFAVFATDGDSNFALIDWKRLTTYTAVNSPAFTTNAGFRGDGASSYIDTNFNPATNGVNYNQNNASRFLWNKIVSVASRWLDGNIVANTNGMYSNNSINNKINQGTANLSAAAPMNNLGLSSINRISSTDVVLFDDTTQYTGTANSSSVSSNNQFIFRGGTNYSNSQTSVYGMGASLVSENTALYNALNTYLTSL